MIDLLSNGDEQDAADHARHSRVHFLQAATHVIGAHTSSAASPSAAASRPECRSAILCRHCWVSSQASVSRARRGQR